MADAPGAEVSLYVLHLALDHLLVSVVRGSMQHVSVAAVHRHVGYWVVRTILLEEDQVTTLEVVLGYPLAVFVPILFCRIVWQLLAELLVDKPCKAGAVFLLVSPAGIGWRVVIGGANVRPAPDGLYAESRSAAVAFSGRPPSVEGVVAACGGPQLEACVAAGGTRC